MSAKHSPDNRTPLLITVDTEGDDLWTSADEARFNNLGKLPQLQQLCDGFGMLPTYLVSHAVAAHRPSAEVLRGLLAAGGCEIGAHLHAWATPPMVDLDRSGHQPYLPEYPRDVQRDKLAALTGQLQQAFGARPTSYRAGRWGLDEFSLDLLEEAGYEVDSSVTPWISWRRSMGAPAGRGGPSFVQAPPGPYHPSSTNLRRPGDRAILEVPVTIGLLGPGREAVRGGPGRWLHEASLPGRVGRKLLARSGVVRTVWLRPLYAESEDMVRLARDVIAAGGRVLNLMFHSSELIDHPRGREGQLLAKLEHFLRAMAQSDMVRGSTLTSFARAWGQQTEAVR